MNNRDFTAPYVFQEYPKWVTLVDGSKTIANSAEEEHILIGPQDEKQLQGADAPQDQPQDEAAAPRRRGRAARTDAPQE